MSKSVAKMKFNLVYEYLRKKVSQPLKEWDLEDWKRQITKLVDSNIEIFLTNKPFFSKMELSKCLGIDYSLIYFAEKNNKIQLTDKKVSREEMIRIFKEKFSYLAGDQAWKLVVGSKKLRIGYERWYNKYLPKLPKKVITFPGRGSKKGQIHFIDFIDFLDGLKSKREGWEKLISVEIVAKKSQFSKRQVLEIARLCGIKISRQLPFDSGQRVLPALLTESDANKLQVLLTQFLTPKGCCSIFQKYKLIKKNQYRLTFKINGENLTVKQLLGQKGLIKKSARGGMVFKKDLALLIAELTPPAPDEGQELLRILRIWAELYRVDGSVWQRIPRSLNSLSKEDEQMLWLLSILGDKEAYKVLLKFYLPVIREKSLKINPWKSLEKKIQSGKDSLSQTLFENLRLSSHPAPTRTFVISQIEDVIQYI